VKIARIVAERFGVASDGHTIDLATGAGVLLKIEVGGDAAEQARWSLRCAALHALQHPRIAPLSDFGGLGVAHRFEAWRCDTPWRGARADRERTLSTAVRFLAACGLTMHDVSASDVFACSERGVLVPPAGTGYPAPASAAIPANRAHKMDVDRPSTVSLRTCGICRVDRPVDRVLDELFEAVQGARPHVISVWGPPGSGHRTVALRAARAARLHGFVPISVALVARIDRTLLEGRLLCVMAHAHDAPVWPAVVQSALASPRAHVLLRFDRHEAAGGPGVRSVPLGRVPPAALASAVQPPVLATAAAARLARAATRAGGLPARFAEQLWGSRRTPTGRGERGTRIISRAAEQPAQYGSLVDVRARASGSEPQPRVRSADLTLRRRLAAAEELLKRGRHEPGVRLLRQTIGGLSRRGEWLECSRATLALAGALLARGDARRALAAAAEAEDSAARADCKTTLLDIAVTSAHAHVDLAELDAAEAIVAAALHGARQLGDQPRILAASLALARCLFWKGQHAESASILAGQPEDSLARQRAASLAGQPEGSRANVPLETCAARAAVGLGDLPRAMALVRGALEEAGRVGEPATIANATRTAAFVRLAAGDLEAAHRDARASIAAARAAHLPMAAIRARLMLAECDRRLGRAPAVAAVLLRMRRVAAHLPPILRVRLELLHDLAGAALPADELVARHTRRCGLVSLPLFTGASCSHRPPSCDDATQSIVGILSTCQSADDEANVLEQVCRQLRAELRAAIVAVFIREGSRAALVASDGPRPEPASGERAITGDLPIAPHCCDHRLEAAAPVRYGGTAIGAVAARWTPGTPYDLSRASGLLTMAATAAAPLVSAVATRRSRPTPPAVTDLLGVTPQMSELRVAIERAAGAPFAVLVEGESGSGKELVARAIHRAGGRRDRPFCTLNCAALPEDLLEAELFGHARGAFTGAIADRTGVFEEAHGGTLFLDEVGELSPRAQAKLLRAIQEGELRRVGENVPRRVDVRIVSATNRNLRQEVEAGRFRLDLLYRLDVIRLAVPALRDRREDIALLAERFWREATLRVGSRAVLAAATLAALSAYHWPGNVRELQNVLASLAVRAPRRGLVAPTALPPQFGVARQAESCRLEEARRTFEERFVRAALVRSGGHRGRAAAELGVTRQGLTKLIARLGIGQAAGRGAVPAE
jgi:DNA-binding NtrC family response regulator